MTAPHPAAITPEIHSADRLEADLIRAVEDHWSAAPPCRGAAWEMSTCPHGRALLFSCEGCTLLVMVVGHHEDDCIVDFQRRAAEPVTRMVHDGALRDPTRR